MYMFMCSCVAGGPSKDSPKRLAADAEHASPADHATSCSLLVRQIRARAAATCLIGGNANHAVSSRFEVYIGTVLGARDPALLRFFAEGDLQDYYSRRAKRE